MRPFQIDNDHFETLSLWQTKKILEQEYGLNLRKENSPCTSRIVARA